MSSWRRSGSPFSGEAGRVDRASLLGTWAFVPFALALVASFVKPIYLDRYLISAAPAFALLGAVALLGVRRRVALVLATVVVAATAVGLVDWYRTADGGNWRGEAWRDAVALVDARRAEADAIVVVPWWANPAATYYGASRLGHIDRRQDLGAEWSETGHRLPAAERAPPLGSATTSLLGARQLRGAGGARSSGVEGG